MANAQAAAMKKKRKLFSIANGFDMPFLIILMLILVIGLVCMYSASYAYAFYWYDGDSYYFIKRQLAFAVLGVVAMLMISTIDYHVLHKFSWVLWIVSLALLVVAYIMPSSTGIHRWIRIPGIGQFQPSEVAKFALIVLYAHLVSLNHKKMKTFTKGYLPFMAILGITCGLVFIEPHLSGTMLLLGIGLILMYVGGTRLVYLLGTIGIGGAAAGYMIFGMGYEKDRIDVWLKPLEMFTKDKDMAWQTVQSLYAIGSGGLMGQGLGNSRQKHLFLPEPQNDFIFSIVCEELGFIGAVLIIILFGLLVWRGFVIGMKAPDKFGSMLAIGLTGQIGLQVAFNVAVVTNTIPNTGISLPFFSYGGTSLVMLLAQMGVVLSVSRSIQAEKA
ncbi:FtsW/RodA/SpoVE family cell cycle protein [Anaeromassilibacillus sp. SJQ-5]|jgi:cell division protein FtsW